MTPPTFVVPLDGSRFAERALPVARGLAERANGRLLLVAALDQGPLQPESYLEEIAAREPRPDIDTIAVTDRHAADAIATIVAEADDRVVCMSSHGRGGLRWAVLGSTAEEVVRRGNRPALLVGRHCRDDFLTRGHDLLACVDGRATAELLAPVASEWAGRLGLALRAAVVVHPLDVESAEHENKLLDPIIRCFGGRDRVRATMLRSLYTEGALADYADDVPAALMAVNTHARSGVTRMVFGSTTTGVVHQAPCPVLVVHASAPTGDAR